MKLCLKCKIEHEDSNFRKKSASKDGLAPWCTPCLKAYEAFKKDVYKPTRDKYRTENKDRESAQKKIYRAENAESIKAKNKEYRDKNKNREYARKLAWKEQNIERVKAVDKEYRLLNKDKTFIRQVTWRAANKDKCNAHGAKRRAQKFNATPPWTDLNVIQTFYTEAHCLTKATGITHHVDHIVPLISDRVCGLHVPYNLRVIPALENLSKSNSWWPDM